MQQNLFQSAEPKPPPIILRPYQQAARDAIYSHLRTRDDHPCVVIPTAGGKTPLIASICRDAVEQWGGRVIVLAHVKELLQQAVDKLQAVCSVPVGVYSAGLGKRDKQQPIVVAGIQSVYQRACEMGPFDLALIDEAHLIPPDGEGMYRKFLAEAKIVNPNIRFIGLTATPFRLKTGTICSADGILNHVCYEVGVRELIVNGFLSPLISKGGLNAVDLSNVQVRAGEYVAEQLEKACDKEELIAAAVDEILACTRDRKACLIFSAGVQHGSHVQAAIEERGHPCGFVTGETPDRERADLLGRFKAGELKYLCNVNVLTTGFDAPHIDCVALLRPTLSPGLYYQMVGRGFRLSPGKANCLVLDFGGNVLRHGPVDKLAAAQDARAKGKGNGDEPPAKQCPECRSLIAPAYRVCPDCGFEFPEPEKSKHAPTAGKEGILSGQYSQDWFDVHDMQYTLHVKRAAAEDAPRTLRVDYFTDPKCIFYETEWICLEHDGFAGKKAHKWWRDRSPDPVPDCIERAVEIAEAGGLAWCKRILVRTIAGERFKRIVGYELGDQPEPVMVSDNKLEDYDLPF